MVPRKLLTPVGLRSLAPGHPDYKPHYFGDLRARDAAYHQGTVWAWLIGPFVDAWLKVHPDDRAGARRFLEGFRPHLDEGALGTISEIFDAEPPFTPARLHRPGLERRRGPPLLGQDGRTGAVTGPSPYREYGLSGPTNRRRPAGRPGRLPTNM